MSSDNKFDSKSIKKLADILIETGLSEIEFESEGVRIRVAKQLTHAPSAMPVYTHSMPPQAMISEKIETAVMAPSNEEIIKSPMVGTAYLSSEPGAAPYIKEGDIIKVGQTLMIIEAMKVMNPLKSTLAGKVKKILVGDTKPVEFDEALIVLERV